MEQQAGAGTLLGLFLPFVIMMVFFWLVLIRPQQKQQKQRQEMLNSLKKGDRVVTWGGIHGEITALKEDIIHLKIADKVEVKLDRSGVQNRINKG
ncbi:MAG: preprotein translocase subunit YajC [Firmicutes bacterium]|jgi:preprotein translocase subunit YajC|nr:preprotein translocase subunit YajC [Bacillota bacterium]HOB21537.1 preprotein translocase subunit YajC [Bacillota bacterium]HQD39012.1 preprotein translocase subunit YajC [Bacillota bacterium]